MIRTAAGTVLTLILAAQGAVAGQYTDDLSKCLVASTTADNRIALVKWIFFSFAAHPNVAPFVTVKPSDLDQINTEVGGLLTQLLTVSCHDKARSAVKHEGQAAMQQGFEVLFEVAGMELARDPKVQVRLQGMSKYVDENKLKALTEEPDGDPAK